jgi:hypothetical protein
LRGVFERPIQRKGPFQRRAFDVLHYQVVGADVVELADVRMVQRRHRARFALEALGEFLLGDLNGDAVQPRIPRPLHLAHASRANERKNLVRAQSLACGERHDGLIVTGERL